tara:strand:- start:1223 stop:1333 length:111 start_codon:yes stop_codon:yes gene_type:complete
MKLLAINSIGLIKIKSTDRRDALNRFIFIKKIILKN